MAVKFAGDEIPKYLVTSKGDLLVGTAAGVVDRYPVGNNGERLLWDSGQTAGVDWALPSMSLLPAVGDYISTPHTTRSSGSVSAGTFRWTPLWLPGRYTFDRIGCEVTALDTTAVVRLGVYNNDATTNKPGSLLLDTTVAGTAIATVEATISLTIGPGLFWIGAVTQSVTVSVSLRLIATAGYAVVPQSSSASAFGSTLSIAYTQGSLTGALPDPAVISGVTSTGVLVTLRRSA